MSVRHPDTDGRPSASVSASARALWFTAPRVAELRTEALASPGHGELLVHSLVSLISSGTELLVYRGDAAQDALELPTLEGRLSFPVKYGHQVVGRVEAAGDGARHAAGDLVFARHPHQDRFIVADDPALVFSLPADLAPEHAVFANLVDVAVNAVLDVPIRIGDAVVVYGAGTVGSLCAQLAKATAGTVILVDPLAAQRDRAGDWGADAVVDALQAPAAIRDLTDGRGADVAMETTGEPAALQAAIEATGQEGTVVAVTFFGSDHVPLRLSPEFHYRRQRMVSTQVSSVGSGLQPRWDFSRRMEVVLDLLRSGRVRVQATHSFPFTEAPDAFRVVDARPSEAMGVLLEY
jgi:2-desacetyl-2-hydroxyethyl bacteriochlorophyllide A dehydrogenase